MKPKMRLKDKRLLVQTLYHRYAENVSWPKYKQAVIIVLINLRSNYGGGKNKLQ